MEAASLNVYKCDNLDNWEMNDDIKNSNLVLGIDEYASYLNPQTLSGNVDFPEHTLYIFGHSLNVTDKDVLKMIICNNNVQTKVF